MKRNLILLILFFVIPMIKSLDLEEVQYAYVPKGFKAFYFYKADMYFRGLDVASNGDILVVGGGGISVHWFENDVVMSSQLTEFVSLNDKLFIDELNGFLYAGTDVNMYRWKYRAGNRTQIIGYETIVTGMPSGGHGSRTPLVRKEGDKFWLYVTIGSGSNVDNNYSRAHIRRYDVTDTNSKYNYLDGEMIFYGVRNEAGLRMSENGDIWGVENGMDELKRDDLGGDIHNENPGEEINRFNLTNRFYGYPYCWSEYSVPVGSTGRNSQHYAPQFTGVYNDSWCNNNVNVVKPVFLLEAHTAPLDLMWYGGSTFTPLVEKMKNDSSKILFVTQHGSWNRQPPRGYRVSYIEFDKDYNPLQTKETPFFAYNSSTSETGENWPHRPVSLKLAPCPVFKECLFFTSDASKSVIMIGYDQTNTPSPSPSPAPSPTPSPTSKPISNSLKIFGIIVIVIVSIAIVSLIVFLVYRRKIQQNTFQQH